LTLVRLHGLDQVTVDMISARAGVSVRTFFNYFPNKVAALVDGPPTPPDDAAVAFRAAGGRRRLLADLVELFVAQLRAVDLDREQLRIRIDLIEATPQLLAPQLAVFDAYERQLARLIAARLAGAPDAGPADEGLAELLAAVSIAAVRSSLYRWCRESGEGAGAGAAEESAETAVRRSMATLRAAFADEA
jgi:AcrR family transcriptional regulator